MEKRILVNGSPYAYKSPMSAYELIEYLGFNINLILLDYNGLILQKENWKTIFLDFACNLRFLCCLVGHLLHGSRRVRCQKFTS